MPNTDDVPAPTGSERTRTGAGRKDTFPPGRRNQPTARPVPPDVNVTGALERLAELGAGVEETPAQRRARRKAERAAAEEAETVAFLTADEPELEPVQSSHSSLSSLSEQPRATSDELRAALDALMIGMRLRLLGEVDDLVWEDFDAACERALLLAAGDDPLASASPVTRFVWGLSGYMRLPEVIDSEDDVHDILALGRAEDSTQEEA